MPPSPGSAFDLLELIGSGGMGDVYRALDRKLGREVALKFLPASFANDRERLDRFRREAQVLASLNHSNIACLYDLHEGEASSFLVMELVPGRTLAEILTSGPLPTRAALATASSLASALEAAHEQGVIHRDLKPANIKITPDGRLKLLDFGLAKPSQASELLSSDDSTRHAHLTSVGVVLGTLAYMSPEQLRAQPLDKRTDIWSFGCVLYEMLAGRPLFAANSTADVIAAILAGDPNPDVSAARFGSLPSLLRRCLRHDPRLRQRDIGDARLEIDEMLLNPAEAPARDTSAGRCLGFQRLTHAVGINESPAVSPDGKMVAFVAAVDGHRQIHVRMLAGGAPLQITHEPEHHTQPRWTPDSSALVYHQTGYSGRLCEVAALGGFPRAIADSDTGADISRDGSRLAFFRTIGGRAHLVVSLRDGTVVRAIGPLPRATFSCPRWSPDDRWIAYCVDEFVFDQRIDLAPSEGGDARTIVRGTMLRGFDWAPDGTSLVYSSSSGSSISYPPTFNLRIVDTARDHDRALTAGDVSFVDPATHASGLIFASRVRSESDVWSFPVDRRAGGGESDARRITHQTGQVQTPTVSPDGRRVAYLSDSGDHGNLWVSAIDGSTARQITFERDPAVRLGVPIWSPDGRHIVYVVTVAGRTSLWVVHPDGSGRRQVVESGFAAGWSFGGQWLYYTPGGRTPYCICKVPIGGGPATEVRSDDTAFIGALPGDAGIICARRGFSPEWDWELIRASPESEPGEAIGTLHGQTAPMTSAFVHTTLSPDGRWLVTPRVEGIATNIWLHPTGPGEERQITDFRRPTIVVRRISWSPDGGRVYAAVAHVDADIVLLEGLL